MYLFMGYPVLYIYLSCTWSFLWMILFLTKFGHEGETHVEFFKQEQPGGDHPSPRLPLYLYQPFTNHEECIKSMYLSRLSITRERTTRSVFEGSPIGLNSEFFFSKTSCYTKMKEPISTLFIYSWRENSCFHIFPKDISTMWNANSLVEDLNSSSKVHLLQNYASCLKWYCTYALNSNFILFYVTFNKVIFRILTFHQFLWIISIFEYPTALSTWLKKNCWAIRTRVSLYWSPAISVLFDRIYFEPENFQSKAFLPFKDNLKSSRRNFFYTKAQFSIE